MVDTFNNFRDATLDMYERKYNNHSDYIAGVVERMYDFVITGVLESYSLDIILDWKHFLHCNSMVNQYLIETSYGTPNGKE